MSRRQSIPNRPGTRILPASYKPEPFPMNTGHVQSFQYKPPSVVQSNSFKNNRVAPPPNYFLEKQSSNSFIQTRPNYYNHIGAQPDSDIGENDKSSWFSKPLCLGLTRLSGGILFGTMIFLSIASIAGLITSVVLYVKDISTDPQWKILGMVVCAIMLLTVFVTLCIFIYCYKQGHITKDNNKLNSLTTPQYHQENDFRHNPYGMVENVSPTPTNEDIVQVHDKLTNTEATISPLRPRDIKRGVWHGTNAYGGLSHRPIEPPKMVHRFSQVLPNEIDQIPSKQRDQIIDIAPKTIIQLPANRREYVEGNRREYAEGNRREYAEGKHPRRFIEPQPQYEMVEEIIRKPKRRQSKEYIEVIELPKKGKAQQRFNKVSVKHIKTIDEPDVVDDDYNTDHFYQ